MASSAVARGARGGRTTIIGQLLKALIQMASVVVLSRLLAPEDFGLIAMVAVAVSLGELLRDFGMTTSGLRARSLSQTQASNLFWVSSALGLVAGIAVAASTPLLVWIYDEPRLTSLAPVLAIAIVVHGVQAQIQVQLARSYRYLNLVATDVIAQLIGFGLAVVGVFIGWGYWALVAQTLGSAISLLVLRWSLLKWVPSRPRRRANSRHLLVSGADFGLAQVLTFAAKNTDTVMIGALWGASPLGLYNRAFQLLTTPISRLLSPLSSVIVPTINAVRAEGGNVANYYLRIQTLIGFGIIGVFAMAGGSAVTLIPLALGAAWSGATPIFQILSLGGMALGLSQVSYWIFITEGKSRELLKYNLVTKTGTVALVVLGSLISVEGTAWAYSVALLLSWPINIVWLGRTASINTRAFLLNGMRIMLTGLVAAIVGALVPTTVAGGNLWAGTGIRMAIVLALYLALTALSREGRRTLTEVLSASKSMIR